jgi:uncharacterized membrane protein
MRLALGLVPKAQTTGQTRRFFFQIRNKERLDQQGECEQVVPERDLEFSVKSIREYRSMSDLIAIIYPSEAKAEEVRQRLFKLQKEYLITISDAVIAVKTESGHVKLNQLVSTTAMGAASGSFWGLLVGVLFLNPILGVALGAASGALGGALTDYGINDAFMKDLAANIQPGNAALFVLIKNMTADKVLKEIQGEGGTVLKTSLDDAKEQMLRDALAKASAAEATPPAAPA